MLIKYYVYNTRDVMAKTVDTDKFKYIKMIHHRKRGFWYRSIVFSNRIHIVFEAESSWFRICSGRDHMISETNTCDFERIWIEVCKYIDRHPEKLIEFTIGECYGKN